MTDRRVRKRRKPSLLLAGLTAVVILVVAAVLFIYMRHAETFVDMDKDSYYGIQSDDQAALIFNDEILDSFGLVRDGAVYIDYDTVVQNLNSGFYWDSESKEMLLTMPSGTEQWSAGDGSGNVIEDNGKIYLSADCIRQNSDIDMEVYADPYRVVARTSWKNLAAETVLKDTAVRYRGGPKAEVLTYVKAGDTVVLTANADDWCQVSTEDGYIGYVKKADLEAASEGTISHTTDKKFVFPKISVDHKVIMAWQYTQDDDGSGEFASLTGNAKGLNTISPTWFTFSTEDGSIRSLASAEYVQEAHNAGMQVWGCLQDVSGGSDGISSGSVLASTKARTRAIQELMQICSDTGMDGINVDIETVTEDTVQQYLQFLRELCVAAHKQNVIVSVDNYVPLYTAYLNRAEQAKYVDYLVIMGYDEHTAGSDEAGPVASLSFVEQGITDTLSEVSADQVINAVPFYTRGWTSVSGEESPSSEALGMNDADEWVSKYGINLTWDAQSGEETGSVQRDQTTYSIWLENERALAEKMKLIRKYDLAGVAAWRLGFERDDAWQIIGNYMGED